MRDAYGRCMRAMCSAESIVDINIAQARQLLCKTVVVLLFFGMEAKVLEQQHVAIFQARSLSTRAGFANTVVCKRDRTFQQIGKMFSDRTKTVLINTLAFRPAKVRSENHTRALLDRILIVGSDAVIRESSSTLPSLIGTLKSTRMKTRWPRRVRSLMESLATKRHKNHKMKYKELVQVNEIKVLCWRCT